MANQNGLVGHFVETYLTQTQNWIYNQIRFQTVYPSVVIGLQLENQDQFPLERVFTLREALPAWRRLLERGIRKFLTGYYPYHYRQAKNQQVKLLHAHFGWTGRHSLPLARALKVPLVTSFYGADMYLRQNDLTDFKSYYRSLFEEGTLFLAEGPAAQQRLVTIGCPPEKTRIQRLGVDLKQLPYRPRQTAIGETIRILMAATFTEKKGLLYGLEAFCQAAQKIDRLQLTIVGDARPAKSEEMQIKQQLQGLVSRYGLDERVNFRGYVLLDELERLMYEHHIFLHPSVTASTGDCEGGSPVVITQVAASGMPVIATNHCDIPQVIRHGETGLLAEERNVEQLRRAILQLTINQKLRLQMGQCGHKHVTEYFSAQKQGSILAEIYRQILMGR